MMFTSANDRTWSPQQNQDIMFQIRRCRFKKGTAFSGTLVNEPMDWVNFTETSWSMAAKKFSPGKIANGFTTTITNAGTGYSGGSPTVSVSGGGGTGLAISATVSGDNISALTVTNPGSGYTSAPTLTISAGSGTQATGTLALTRGRVDTWNSLNKYATITTLSGGFTSGMIIGTDEGYATISSFRNKIIDEMAVNIGILKPGDGTSAKAELALTTTGAGSANTTSFQEVDFETTHPMKVEKTIYSRANEVATYSSTQTGRVKLTFQAYNDNVSPYILSLIHI